MKRASVIVFVAVVALAAVTGATTALQSSSATTNAATFDTQSGDYDITVEGSVQIPTREATVEGSTFQVSAVAKQNTNANYIISVDAPSGANYDLLLKRGSDYRTAQAIRNSVDGDYSAEFDMADLEPSTYYIAVESDGVQAVHPLIVKGYDVSMTTADSVERGNSVDVFLSLSQVDPDARSAEVVQVVVGNDSESVQVNATRTNSGNYEATVDTDSLSPGTYSVYGIVRGPQELESGDLESLGVSDRQAVTIESTATPTPTATQSSSTNTGGSSGGGSSGGGSSGGGGGSMTTATATPTPNSTMNGTATPTPNSTTNGTATPTPTVTTTPTSTTTGSTVTTTPTPTTTDTTASPSPTPTDDDVVTPATTSADGGPATETGGQPGLGAIVGTVALLAGALLLTRRRREN